MTQTPKPTDKPNPAKPNLPGFQKPGFIKPNLGGFKNQKFPMPTIPRGVR